MLFEILEVIAEVIFSGDSSKEPDKNIRLENRVCNWLLAVSTVVSTIILIIFGHNTEGSSIVLYLLITFLLGLIALFVLIKLEIINALSIMNFFKVAIGVSLILGTIILLLFAPGLRV